MTQHIQKDLCEFILSDFCLLVLKVSTFAITTAILKEVTAMRETLLLLKLNIDLCMRFCVNAVSQKISGSNFNYCDHDSYSCLFLKLLCSCMLEMSL